MRVRGHWEGVGELKRCKRGFTVVVVFELPTADFETAPGKKEVLLINTSNKDGRHSSRLISAPLFTFNQPISPKKSSVSLPPS